MPKTSLSTIKNWFKNDDKPSQTHFWNWMDSFWHKDESIPQSSISELVNVLSKKASTNHTHTDLAKLDASNLTEENVLSWQEALAIHFNALDNQVKLSQAFEFLELTEENMQSDFNSVVANRLETQQSTLDNKLSRPEDEGNTVDFPFVVGMDEDGASARIPADNMGKNLGNSDIDIIGPRIIDTNGNPLSIKGLPNKSADLTFTEILGQNSDGETAKVGGKAILGKLQTLSAADINTLFTLLNGSYTSSQISSVGVFPPVLEKDNTIQEITVMGNGLIIPEDVLISKVEILHVPTNTYYQVGYQNVSANKLIVFVDTSIVPLGNCLVRITSGVQSHITSLTPFEIADAGTINEIDVNSLAWTRQKHPTSTQSGNAITYTSGNIINNSRALGLDSAISSSRIKEALFSSTAIISAGENFMIEFDVFLQGQAMGSGSGGLIEFAYPDIFGIVKETAISGSNLNSSYFTANASSITTNNLIYGFRNYVWESNLLLNYGNALQSSVPVASNSYQYATSLFLMKKGNDMYFVINGFAAKMNVSNSDSYRLIIGAVNSAATATFSTFTPKRFIKF